MMSELFISSLPRKLASEAKPSDNCLNGLFFYAWHRKYAVFADFSVKTVPR